MLPIVELTVCDTEYRVKPGFRVIEAWEERVGIHEVARGIMGGNPRYKDMAWVVYAAVRYGDEDGKKAPAYYDVGDWVMSNFEDAVRACNDLIGVALNAGSEETRPKKPQPKPEKS